jgi:hypothetical protein
MISIKIDKLTNSIINAVTGDVFNTEVLIVSSQDLKKKSNGILIGKKSKSKVKYTN